MKEFFPAIIVMAIFILSAYQGKAIACEVIGHRGAAFYAPENTVVSIKTAFKMGADGVEIDVHLTKDGKIAVIHDSNTERTCAGEKLNIKETEFSELRKLDAGIKKGEKFAGEKIPALEEIIRIIPEGKKLLIEIKCGTEILKILADAVKKSGKAKHIVIIGFSLEAVAMAKILLPESGAFWIVNKKTLSQINEEDIVKIAKNNRLDGIDADYKIATRKFIEDSHKAGLKFYAWTVDKTIDAIKLKLHGLDALASNKPDIIKKALK